MGSREEEMEGSIKASLLLWREGGKKGWWAVLIRLVCYTGRREEGMAGSVRLVCCSGRLCTGFNKWTKVPSVSFSTQAFKIKHFKPSSVKSWRSSWKITRILHARMDLPWGTAVHNRLSILDQAHSPCMHGSPLRNRSPHGISVLACRPSQVCSCNCRERVLMKNIPSSFGFPRIPCGLGLNTQLFRSSCGV